MMVNFWEKWFINLVQQECCRKSRFLTCLHHSFLLVISSQFSPPLRRARGGKIGRGFGCGGRLRRKKSLRLLASRPRRLLVVLQNFNHANQLICNVHLGLPVLPAPEKAFQDKAGAREIGKLVIKVIDLHADNS